MDYGSVKIVTPYDNPVQFDPDWRNALATAAVDYPKVRVDPLYQFLYYWKNEDFGERYGTSDTVEMEDTLRSVFKQFGDLALTLRRKAVDAD